MNDFNIPAGDCFTHNYLVSYSDVSSRGTLKHSSAINYFQDLAVLHSDAVGYTLDYFKEHSQGWILTCWHILFGKMPGEGEQIKAETWTKPYKRSQAYREFALLDSEGKPFAWASSRWVLMDTNRRRPAKLDKEFFIAYSFPNGRDCSDQDYAIDFPADDEGSEDLPGFVIPVMRRDTDTNKHANNSVYIDWAMDGVPDEIYDNKNLAEVIVTYKKECRRGDTVNGTMRRNGNDILCTLNDNDDPKKEFGKVLMRWE